MERSQRRARIAPQGEVTLHFEVIACPSLWQCKLWLLWMDKAVIPEGKQTSWKNKGSTESTVKQWSDAPDRQWVCGSESECLEINGCSVNGLFLKAACPELKNTCYWITAHITWVPKTCFTFLPNSAQFWLRRQDLVWPANQQISASRVLDEQVKLAYISHAT